MPYSEKRLEEDHLEEKQEPRLEAQGLDPVPSFRLTIPVKKRASCFHNLKSETAHSTTVMGRNEVINNQKNTFGDLKRKSAEE